MCPAAVNHGDERGYIIPIGGGEDKDAHPVILQRFVELAGGRNANIAVFPTASRLEETGTLCELRIESQLRGHDAAEVGDFTGVLQNVLGVTGAVFQTSDEADDLGVHVVDPQVEGGRLTGLLYRLVELFFHLLDYLLDPRRVNPAVGNEPLQGDPCRLATNGVER